MTNKKIPLFFYVIPASVVIFFFYLHIRYSVNIPIMDDYDAVIYFLSSFIDSTGIYDKFLWMITQHREHRYVFPRVIILGYYFLIGTINFKVLLFMGLGSLVGIYLLMLRSIKFNGALSSPAGKFFMITSVTFIIFNIQYWEGSTWAIASFFFYFGLLFGFLSLYYISKDPQKHFLTASIFAILSVATSGNGLLVLITAAVLIFFQSGFSKRLIYWIILTAAVFILYFFKYVSPTDQTPVSEIILHKQYKLVIFYLAYIGSVFRQLPVAGYHLSIISGVLFISALIFLLIKKYYKLNPANFGYIIFLLLTMLASSLGRVDVGFISRYTVFSSLLLACICIAFMELYSGKINKAVLVILLIFSVVFNLYSYRFNITDMKKMKDILVNGAILANAGDYSLLVYPDSASVKTLVNLGYSKNIYRFPDFGNEDLAACKSCLNDAELNESIEVEINSYTDNEKYFYINGWVTSGNDPDIDLVLKDGEKVYVFETISMRRKELTEMNKKREVNTGSFSFVALKNSLNLPPGNYRVEFCISSPGKRPQLINTGKIISF